MPRQNAWSSRRQFVVLIGCVVAPWLVIAAAATLLV